MVLVLMRHGESTKNLENRHGYSEGGLTATGRRQLAAVGRYLRLYCPNLTRIRYGPTIQCEISAVTLSVQLSMADVQAIDLEPYFLGAADGRSEAEFERDYPTPAERLQHFRLGLVGAEQLNLPGSESIEHLDLRLRRWWQSNEAEADGTLFVLSRSLILMLNAAVTSRFPASYPMYDWAMPTAGIRLWHRSAEVWSSSGLPNRSRSWPHTSTIQLNTGSGIATATEFTPGYFQRNHVLIIVPGLFSNTRHGPYNLYSRIAFATSKLGVRTIIYDPPGSGDSSPLPRSFKGDTDALITVANSYGGEPILLTHSAGIAVAQAAIAKGLKTAGSIAVAPTMSRQQILRTVLDAADVETAGDPIAIRSGVEYRSSYLDDVQRVATPASVDVLFLAAEDQYVTADEARTVLSAREIYTIASANHSFAHTKASATLIASLLDILTDMTTPAGLGICI